MQYFTRLLHTNNKNTQNTIGTKWRSITTAFATEVGLGLLHSKPFWYKEHRVTDVKAKKGRMKLEVLTNYVGRNKGLKVVDRRQNATESLLALGRHISTYCSCSNLVRPVNQSTRYYELHRSDNMHEIPPSHARQQDKTDAPPNETPSQTRAVTD